jgi:hypothetical protein
MYLVKIKNFAKIKNFDYYIAFIGYVLLALFIMRLILLDPGTIGFYHDWTIGPYAEMNKVFTGIAFYVWDEQYGNKSYATDWLVRVALYLPFSFLGGEVLSKGFLVSVISLSGFTSYCLGRQLKLSSYSSFAVGVLYIFSPVVFTRIVAGYLWYLLAYFLTPLILTVYLIGRLKNKMKYFIICGILVAFAISQIQFLVIIFLILVTFSLIDFVNIRKNMLRLLVIFSIAFMITLSPIILAQTLKGPDINTSFRGSQLLSYYLVVNAADILKSFRLLGYEPNTYSYSFLFQKGIIPPFVFYLDFLLPIIGFSALLFRRDKYTISFATISLLGLFLLKGLNPPFADVFKYLFLSGFYIFREVWHIALLYSFSITFLVAFFLEKLRFISISNFVKLPLSLVLISLVVISNGYPLLIGTFGGYVQTYNFPEESHNIYKTFSLNNTYNILLLPYVAPIKYDGLKHEGYDPTVAWSPNQLFSSNILPSNPTTSMASWLLSVIRENRTDHLGKLLTGVGIKYIILRSHIVSNYPQYTPLGLEPGFTKRWNSPIEPSLDSQKDLAVIYNGSNYKIYENTNNASKIFASTVPVGGLSDFNSLLLISNFTSIANIAAYPSTYGNEALNFLDDPQEKKILGDDFIDLGTYADSYNAGTRSTENSGWVDSKLWLGYDYLLDSRVHHGAFTGAQDASLTFDVPTTKYHNKVIEIWLKALVWNRGGSVSFDINGLTSNHSLSSLETSQSSGKKIVLFKVFEGNSTKPLHVTIRNIDGINYLEGIYVDEKQSNSHKIQETKNYLMSYMDDTEQRRLVSNPDFIFFNSQLPATWDDSHNQIFFNSQLPATWDDSRNQCRNNFKCTSNYTSGWNDNTSFQISTTKNRNDTWSDITGKPIDVSPNEQYELVTHMKLNKFAIASHVVLEGFNQSSRQWDQVVQCPDGTNGPLEWSGIICDITIPENITQIRPVLNAGWSSQRNEEAITMFDAIYLSKITNKTDSPNPEGSTQVNKVISEETSLKSPSIVKEFHKVNPTLWNVQAKSTEPFILGFAEPYDPLWEATVHRDDKKVSVVNPIHLYGTINGFPIKDTGDLDIVIRYTRQDAFEMGLVISALTFAFCLLYLVLDWKNNYLKKIFREHFHRF